MGLGIAVAAAALVAVGVALGRPTRTAGDARGLIASSLAVALVAAACGVVIVAAGADAYLGATVPACSTDESRPTLSYCSHPGDLGRQAGAVGVLGGLLAGVVGGALAAWRRSRSLRIVTGGTVAALGAAVLAVEALIVLVLWSH